MNKCILNILVSPTHQSENSVNNTLCLGKNMGPTVTGSEYILMAINITRIIIIILLGHITIQIN